MKRILIAGIGNIFLGDDAFGVEVVQQLLRRPLPPQVHITDFGIRSYDLAYALSDGFDAAILVDATSRGQPPGTVYLLELDRPGLQAAEIGPPDAHSLNPVHVLRLAEHFGACPDHLYLVGCEPAEVDCADGQLGLSQAVAAAVPTALDMIESLVSHLLTLETQVRHLEPA